MTTPLAIEATGLVKRFGAKAALDGVDISVPTGTVTAVLGPNGAGKTTAVRILTTLSDADEGTATVAGFDVGHPGQRGPAPHRPGRPGRHRRPPAHRPGEPRDDRRAPPARPRARPRPAPTELLEQFSLTDAADRVASGYSGGMRRRLDLAATLVARPQVLFLDEPTTGLDPRARNELWAVLDTLVGRGTTLLLTTQYLEEADRLADDILVVDHGQVIARGDARSLKRQVGGDNIGVDRGRPRGPRPTRPSIARAACTGGDPVVDRPLRTDHRPTTGRRRRPGLGRQRAGRRRARGRGPQPAPAHPRRGVPHPHRVAIAHDDELEEARA